MSALRLKTPDAVLTYTFSWADVIVDPVVLDSVAYTVPTGLTLDTQVLDSEGKASSIVLSGGSHGVDYLVTARATLSNGEKPTGSLTVRCVKH